MIEKKHTSEELRQMQQLPLEAKILMTERRIKEYYDYFDGSVYVSFSGGKDSTVLLHIVRSLYPDVPAVFSDTGLEFPEIREFVKTVDNVIWLKPEMNYKNVIKTYGYPIITKRVADAVQYGSKPGTSRWNMLHGLNEPRKDGKPSEFDFSKYGYLLDAPFKVSAKCCDIMKKNPLKKFQKESGAAPIIGTMAQESRARKREWIKGGCNLVDNKEPSSRPLSFWIEDDILRYIKEKDIEYCKIYGDIVEIPGVGGGAINDNGREKDRLYVLRIWLSS